jgi:hypothetical protein
MLQAELTRAREVENTATLASCREDAKGLVRKVTLLEGGLAEARQAREAAEEKFHSLSDTSADGARWLMVFERERRKQFEELSLLRARGSEPCLTIVGSPRVRNHLLEGMQVASLCHTEMAGELAALQAAVSSDAELVLGRSLDESFWVEVIDKLVAKFQRLEELCS